MTTNVNFQINGKDFDDLFVRSDIFTEGGLWTWGSNILGQLGDNTTVSKSSPVQTVSGGTNWKQISSGTNSHMGAIKTDGTLWLWGNNDWGQLGNSSKTLAFSSPVQTVSGGNNWKQVSCDASTTGAIKTDGTLWMFGLNDVGQLGDNTRTNRSSPVQTVSAGTDWKQINVLGGSTCAAIKTDGTLWTWGFNYNGEAGDNTRTPKSSPVQTVAGGNNWKQVDGGSSTMVAIKTDGTLWTWGKNAQGQLGDGTVIDKSSPVQTVAGGTNWKLVSGNGDYIAAIKTDGTLWGWGENANGQLGDNTTVSKSSPVQTVSGGTNWKFVSGGSSHTGAIKTDGTLWFWGNNFNGEFGDTNRTSRSSPVQINSETNWKQVACGGSFTGAVITDYWI